MSTIISQLKPLKIGDLTARLPIIQGGMGVGISLSSLAGSVAAAGGVGIISTAQIGFREPVLQHILRKRILEPLSQSLRRHAILQRAVWSASISWLQRKTMLIM